MLKPNRHCEGPRGEAEAGPRQSPEMASSSTQKSGGLLAMTLKIKSLALELGFDEVGITSIRALKEGERAVEVWVREGRHGGMKYLEDFKKRRERFFGDFPDAKSVIVLGVNYYTGRGEGNLSSPNGSVGDPNSGFPIEAFGNDKIEAFGNDKIEAFGNDKIEAFGNDKALQGRVARYAWGRDYHEVIQKKHEEFIERLQQRVEHDGKFERGGGSRTVPHFQAKSCVDIQPIPERFAAAKAGLGFVGKNTMLLSKKFGPWLFLSEVVTNLELKEDMPEAGDCGRCTHCQKICPTGALDKDYTIDARRCIAYLTIEHKGAIPEELRPKIKDWIFGCDECLNVCPFTSKSKESPWKEFHPESGLGNWLEIEKLFEIKSNSEYERRFRGTALMRASRKQMLRNACLVLANSGKEIVIPYLKKALLDPSPLVRLHAAWGLGQFSSEEAKGILRDRWAQESDPEVQQEISFALSP